MFIWSRGLLADFHGQIEGVFPGVGVTKFRYAFSTNLYGVLSCTIFLTHEMVLSCINFYLTPEQVLSRIVVCLSHEHLVEWGFGLGWGSLLHFRPRCSICLDCSGHGEPGRVQSTLLFLVCVDSGDSSYNVSPAMSTVAAHPTQALCIFFITAK